MCSSTLIYILIKMQFELKMLPFHGQISSIIFIIYNYKILFNWNTSSSSSLELKGVSELKQPLHLQTQAWLLVNISDCRQHQCSLLIIPLIRIMDTFDVGLHTVSANFPARTLPHNFPTKICSPISTFSNFPAQIFQCQFSNAEFQTSSL